MIVHVRFIGSPLRFLFRPTWIQPLIPELAVLLYADRRVRLNLPSPRDRTSQTGESSALAGSYPASTVGVGFSALTSESRVIHPEPAEFFGACGGHSFVTQGHYGIDAHRPPGGNKASY